jgi:hypothetical protein
MRFLKMTSLAVFALTVAACGGSESESSSADAWAGAEANLDAESFDSTITSDDASSLNEAESRQLNVATE